jgi:hypothetical protein
MQQPAKKSKSLLNSFNRIHRLATLGGVSIAAWFSSQLLQLPSQRQSEEDASISSSAPMMQGDEAAMKSVMPESLEMSQNTAQTPMQTGEPSFDVLWSVVAVLSVIIAGLVIEIIISSRKKKVSN